MYRHVIVPFDGILEHRAVLAPAADLAWRCGAKLVVVTTNASDHEDVKLVLKHQAITKSGADVDFWVDLGIEIDEALLGAAAHRTDPVVCITSRHQTKGLLRPKVVDTPLPGRVLVGAPCPVVVVGPETDVSRGLQFSTLYLPTDEVGGGERAAELAVEWAVTFRVNLHLVAMVPRGGDSGPVVAEAEALLARVRAVVPHTLLEVIETDHPGAALAAIASDDADGLVLLGRTGAEGDEPLGPYAAEAVAASRRAVVFPPVSSPAG